VGFSEVFGGIFEKTVVTTWYFDGQLVVKCVVEMVI
jgi:hypothetical protein